VVAAAAPAPDLAAHGAPAAVAPSRSGHLKVVRPEPAEFTAFYEAYTRKTARAEALKAWRKLAPDAALVVQIMAAVEAQKAVPGSPLAPVNGKGYIPYPASWINGARWLDEIIPASPANGSTPSPAQPLLTEFGRLYEAKVTYPYVANSDRDLKILEDLLAQRNGRGEVGFPPATLLRLMKGFFKYPPQWAREKDRFDIPMFKASFPELTRMLERNDI
jgi:hypothetical protein